jgi:hypothetical protein
MRDDFPAAHSMDTEWYAVDQQGHVAVFSSDENGHVPAYVGQDDILWELQQAREPHEERWQSEELAGRFGFFSYHFGMNIHGFAATYYRDTVPEKPLHVDELPPELRRRCKTVRFEALAFAHSEQVQPLEFVECRFWGHYAAYVCGDGKTVRPVPGHEAGFAELCREAQADDPDGTRQFVFEGLTEGPPPPGQAQQPHGRDAGQGS